MLLIMWVDRKSVKPINGYKKNRIIRTSERIERKGKIELCHEGTCFQRRKQVPFYVFMEAGFIDKELLCLHVRIDENIEDTLL